jgi:hypothetical protein
VSLLFCLSSLDFLWTSAALLRFLNCWTYCDMEYRFLEAMPPCADDQIMMRPLAGTLVFTF